jgi:hypothetical protein
MIVHREVACATGCGKKGGLAGGFCMARGRGNSGECCRHSEEKGRWGRTYNFVTGWPEGCETRKCYDASLENTMTLQTWKKADLKNLSELLIRLYCKEETYHELGSGRREVEAVPGPSAREVGRIDGR